MLFMILTYAFCDSNICNRCKGIHATTRYVLSTYLYNDLCSTTSNFIARIKHRIQTFNPNETELCKSVFDLKQSLALISLYKKKLKINKITNVYMTFSGDLLR